MSSILANGGGLEALLEAAKFLEEQEKQKLGQESTVLRRREEVLKRKGPSSLVHDNGDHHYTRQYRIHDLPPHWTGSTRELHTRLEKRRRIYLKGCFEWLKRQLPPSVYQTKTCNQIILHSALQYIKVLKKREKEFRHELKRLAHENSECQQKLEMLKKELSVDGKHTDLKTLLELEPRLANQG